MPGPEPRILCQASELSAEVGRVDRGGFGGGEHEVIRPRGAEVSSCPFVGLALALCAEGVDHDGWRGERSPRPLGLQVFIDVEFPAFEFEGAADVDDATVEVDVMPGESGGFAGSESDGSVGGVIPFGDPERQRL